LRIWEPKSLLWTPPSTGLSLWALLFLFMLVSPARGEDDDLRTLELFNGSTADVVSASRSPRPASQSAENITVVTASEIEALNAHTLADVLYAITGVQLRWIRTPGTLVTLQIQGSQSNHILVMIDSVPINLLSDNTVDISSVPVQMIERIEIVKGAASSSWGSALGGVVNVITKSPNDERSVAGLVSTSFGKRETLDHRAELGGTIGRFGYYLTGGKLKSDGLLPNNESEVDSLYGKLQYQLPVRGSVSLTTGFTDNESGQFGTSTQRADQDVRQLISTLNIQYPVSDSLSIQGMLRRRKSEMEITGVDLVRNRRLTRSADESANGASLLISYRDDLQRVVAGADYDHVKADLVSNAQGSHPRADRVGVYLNDTLTLGAFAITPSARFDHTGTGDNLLSPSFGITYAVTENSVLRGYTARGYSITSINLDNSTEKVWTSQLGFESADIPYLWLKGTLFRNDTWNVRARVGPTTFVKQSELKQGYELEARTTPLFGASLSFGYTYIHAKNEDTDAVVLGIAKHTVNLGIKYEDRRYLRALLTGRYIDWNVSSTDVDSDFDDMVWDLHLSKSIRYSEYGSIELFLSLRNLFNGNQYVVPMENPRRWGELGVRCQF
jgi:vitamin B12 transporter